MSPEELAEIEARLKAATPGRWAVDALRVVRGTTVVCTLPLNYRGPAPADADFIAHAPSDIAALLAEVRRLTPAVKVERKPACKVAVWGPVRGTWGVAALRVNKRIKAHYNGRDRAWWAYTNGVAHARRVDSEAEARAHIEAWARGKGWEVRDA